MYTIKYVSMLIFANSTKQHTAEVGNVIRFAGNWSLSIGQTKILL